MPDDNSMYEGIAPVAGQLPEGAEVIDLSLAHVEEIDRNDQKQSEGAAAQKVQDAFDAYVKAVEDQVAVIARDSDRISQWHRAAVFKHEYKRLDDTQKAFGKAFETMQGTDDESMMEAEQNLFQYNGRTFFLKRQLRAKLVDGVSSETLLERLDMCGLGELAVRKADSRALTKVVSELDKATEGKLTLDELAEQLPTELHGILKVESEIILSHRIAAAAKTHRK